jgi:ribose transport system substrate-binding protein
VTIVNSVGKTGVIKEGRSFMIKVRLGPALASATVGIFVFAGPTFADDFMDKVKAEVVTFAGPQSDWRGPTSAPKPVPGKHVAYLANDAQNDATQEWANAVKEAGAKLGWETTIIDGHGSPVGWQQGFNQAIALKVDGIVTDADAASLQPQIQDAKSKGIVIVGSRGRIPRTTGSLGLFVNIQDPARHRARWVTGS